MAWREYVDPTDGQVWSTDDAGNFLPGTLAQNGKAPSGGTTTAPNITPTTPATSNFDWSKLWGSLTGSNQQQFDEMVREFNAQMDLQGKQLGLDQQKIDEMKREYDRTLYSNLAQSLLSGATSLATHPGDWLSYANYTNGGKDIFQSLFGSQASPAFGAPTGYSKTGSITDVLNQLGVPKMPGVSAPAASQWYQQMVDWYDKAKQSGAPTDRNAWVNSFVTLTGLTPDIANQMYDRGTAYIQTTGQRAPADVQQQWLQQYLQQGGGGTQQPGQAALTAPSGGGQYYTQGAPAGTSGQQGSPYMTPLPYQINPAVWDSMSDTAKQMILASANAGNTPSGSWTSEDYLKQLNAARPQGTAPKQVSYNWGSPSSSYF